MEVGEFLSRLYTLIDGTANIKEVTHARIYINKEKKMIRPRFTISKRIV